MTYVFAGVFGGRLFFTEEGDICYPVCHSQPSSQTSIYSTGVTTPRKSVIPKSFVYCSQRPSEQQKKKEWWQKKKKKKRNWFHCHRCKHVASKAETQLNKIFYGCYHSCVHVCEWRASWCVFCLSGERTSLVSAHIAFALCRSPYFPQSEYWMDNNI